VSAAKGKVESLSIRMYLQDGDRYLAIASVERRLPADAEPGAKPEPSERYTGTSETTLGAALASVLQISRALEE
jgi:hypothetical protein